MSEPINLDSRRPTVSIDEDEQTGGIKLGITVPPQIDLQRIERHLQAIAGGLVLVAIGVACLAIVIGVT